MPRRASSGINTGQIIGISAAVIGFLLAAVLMIKVVGGDLFGGGGNGGGNSTSFKNASELRLTAYRDNANSLRGNVYKVTGRVEETLKWTPDRGRLISLDATSDGISMPVPVMIPEDFSSINIDRGAEMSMVVRVGRDGTLTAESIED
ncbi:hypothetical protein OAE61_01345 [Verrucomicrobiales bacterium]|nr:hypothetical protein [Verrucomicrobiales bacterium]MDB4657471.1 hypothetical protein [Verrucomicrobiales bacterium]MDB4662258.1 hypothetical protein [Verrucomicrobiales bacterium]MDC0275693.1 hypothetical protein [Verrucomicrobiales bacterium]